MIHRVALVLAAVLTWPLAASAQPSTVTAVAERVPAPPAPVTATRIGLLSTGSTLEGGHVSIEVNELGLWDRVSVGITDRIELAGEVMGPGSLASISGRVQLTPPASPLKLTAGGGVWGTLVDDSSEDRPVFHATGSAGWHGADGFAFVNATLFMPSGEWFALYTGGLAARVGERSAFAGIGGKLALEARGEDSIAALGGTYKYMGKSWGFDLGLLFAHVGDAIVPVPLVSLSFRG